MFFSIVVVSVILLIVNQAGAISRSKIISNADTWLHPPVAYSQTSYHNGYRQDCSGYVSMAWVLGNSETTSSLPNKCMKISKSDLQSGDILLNPGSHTLIFDKWTDSSKTNYWSYEQHPSETHYASIPYPYWSNYDPSSYFPCRYNGVSATQGELELGFNATASF